MTLRDKVKEIEPDKVSNEKYNGGVSCCPEDYDYLEGRYMVDCGGESKISCEDCWSQEYIEDFNCENCKHYHKGLFEEPCDKCKHGVSPNNEEYETRPVLFEPKEVVDSNVNHPNHYQGKNECIDVMVAMFGKEAVKHFCMCNAYKYRFRADKKNGEEDIKKAEWYESKLIELGGVK